jgi:hypothetical protein
MKPPVAAWNRLRAVSSIDTSSWGSAAFDRSRRRMIPAAWRPAGESALGSASTPASGLASTWPPAERIRALIQTM